MSQLPTFEEGVAEVRVRVNWRGRPVLQVRRKLFRCRNRSAPPSGAVTRVEDMRTRIGVGQWRDATREDTGELYGLVAMNKS